MGRCTEEMTDALEVANFQTLRAGFDGGTAAKSKDTDCWNLKSYNCRIIAIDVCYTNESKKYRT